LKKAVHSRLSHRAACFRKGISTENAAFRPTDRVFKCINHKIHVGGIFYDLEKTFDYVNHEIFLAKLHFYSIRGVSEDWFGSYLRRRKVEIKLPNAIQNFFSDWDTLKHGVPRGQF
jgi:hypothetical protein